jgi:hypothetical protein
VVPVVPCSRIGNISRRNPRTIYSQVRKSQVLCVAAADKRRVMGKWTTGVGHGGVIDKKPHCYPSDQENYFVGLRAAGLANLVQPEIWLRAGLFWVCCFHLRHKPSQLLPKLSLLR